MIGPDATGGFAVVVAGGACVVEGGGGAGADVVAGGGAGADVVAGGGAGAAVVAGGAEVGVEGAAEQAPTINAPVTKIAIKKINSFFTLVSSFH